MSEDTTNANTQDSTTQNNTQADPTAVNGDNKNPETKDVLYDKSKSEGEGKTQDVSKPEGDKGVEDKDADNQTKASSGADEDAKASDKKIEYDLKLPEGSQLAKEDVDGIAAYAREQNLSNEVAQAILNRESFKKAEQEKEMQALSTQWKKEILSDKVFGGEAFPKNAELASRFVKANWSKEAVEYLNSSGLGNHPDLVRTCIIAAQNSANDSIINGKGQGAKRMDTKDVLYGGKKE